MILADHVVISKYKSVFAKAYTLNWSEQVFVIKKVKILCHEQMQQKALVEKKLLERFMKKNWNRKVKRS